MNGRHWATWVLGFVALLASLAPGRAANAQVPTAVYEDARDIIEELIQKEVAQSVVPNVICRTAHDSVFAAELKKKNPSDDVLKAHPPFLMQYYPRTLQRIFRRRFSALRGAVVDESAGVAGHVVYSTLVPPEAAPAAAATAKLIALKLAGGDDALVEKVGRQYVWSTPDEGAVSKCVEKVRAWYEGDPAEVSLTPLDQACAQGESPSTAHAYACNVGLAVRALLLRRAPLAEEHLIKATALLIGEVGVAAVGKAWSPRLQENVTLALRQFLYDDAKAVDHVVDAFEPAAGGERTALSSSLKGLEYLRTQWRLGTIGGTQKLDVAYFVREMSVTTGSLGALCANFGQAGGGQAARLCAQVKSQREALGGGPLGAANLAMAKMPPVGDKLNLWSIVQLASRGEYADVASQVMGAFFSSQNGNDDAGGGIYRRFAESLVHYVLDSADERSPSDTTRAAFREAAVEVLQDLSQGGGMDRSFGGAVIRPDLALRFSWSPAYVNEGSASSRFVASATLVNFRFPHVYTSQYYVATQISLLDPLAPLGELAQRPTSDVRYEQGSRLLANLVSPRLDLIAGIPALSRHLVVAAGVSLRPSAPFRANDQAACTDPRDERVCYRYKFIWNKNDGVRDMSGFSFLEFGFALKYML